MQTPEQTKVVNELRQQIKNLDAMKQFAVMRQVESKLERVQNKIRQSLRAAK